MPKKSYHKFDILSPVVIHFYLIHKYIKLLFKNSLDSFWRTISVISCRCSFGCQTAEISWQLCSCWSVIFNVCAATPSAMLVSWRCFRAWWYSCPGVLWARQATSLCYPFHEMNALFLLMASYLRWLWSLLMALRGAENRGSRTRLIPPASSFPWAASQGSSTRSRPKLCWCSIWSATNRDERCITDRRAALSSFHLIGKKSWVLL